jgi:hypothetical protein
MYCYHNTNAAECGPTCIRLNMNLDELAATCAYNIDWDLIPGQLWFTRGCNLVSIYGTYGPNCEDIIDLVDHHLECEGRDGWFFSGETGEQNGPLVLWPIDMCDSIELCPKTCSDLVQSGELTALYMKFGCFPNGV